MKHLTEKFNNTNSIGSYIAVNEAWALNKNFEKELNQLFKDYEDAKSKNDAKLKKSPYAFTRPAEEKLSKYPATVLAQHTDINLKSMMTLGRAANKEVIHKGKYGAFIIKGLEDGKFTKEDLIKWWKDYEENVAKANYHDPKWLLKQIDPTRLWNPYYPKDDSCIQAIADEPATIMRYINTYKLSKEERDDLNQFLVDPVNQPALQKAIKSAKNSWMKLRPTFSEAAIEHLKHLIKRAKLSDDQELEDLLKDEYKERGKSYYSGGNSRGCMGTAIVSVILKAINAMYGFEVYHSIESDEDSYSGIKQKVRFKDKIEDASLEGFVDDADYLSIEVKDLGVSKKEDKPTVSSSSFTTNYYHDFEVIITKNKEVVLDNTYENITVGSYFFSGGW